MDEMDRMDLMDEVDQVDKQVFFGLSITSISSIRSIGPEADLSYPIQCLLAVQRASTSRTSALACSGEAAQVLIMTPSGSSASVKGRTSSGPQTR